MQKVYKQQTEYTPEQANYESCRLEVLENHLSSLIDKGMLQSASYLLAKDNKVFAGASMGKLNYKPEDKRPFLPESHYGVYSITKWITAAALLRLVEDGKLLLAQSVGSIIKEFDQPPFNEIKVIHLLTHTSGLYYDEGCKPDPYHGNIHKEMASDTWIEEILKHGLSNKPGVEWQYSSLGYNVLGEVITRVSGMFCHDYITEKILKPCGMNDTTWGYDSKFRDLYSSRFDWQDKAIKSGRMCLPPIPCTWNGLVSTNSDLMKFALMLLNKGKVNGKHVLGKIATELMFSNHTPGVKTYCWGANGADRNYGLGPDIAPFNNKEYFVTPGCVTHEGWGTCAVMIDIKENFAAIWSAQFAGDTWSSEPLRNTSAIIWSGIE